LKSSFGEMQNRKAFYFFVYCRNNPLNQEGFKNLPGLSKKQKLMPLVGRPNGG
jgi:hypothetical protein